MIINLEVLSDDALAEKVGAELAKELQLKRSACYNDRWETGWGNKTNKGLARTVLWQIGHMINNYRPHATD